MLVRLIQKLQQSPHQHLKYKWRDRVLTRKDKLVIGSSLPICTLILDWMHSSPQGGHSGVNATEKCVKSMFYWKGLLKDIRANILNANHA